MKSTWTVISFVCCTAVAGAASAQVSQTREAGYTVREGFTVTQNRIEIGNVYNQVDFATTGSVGLTSGVFLKPNLAVEFAVRQSFQSWSAIQSLSSRGIGARFYPTHHLGVRVV